MRYLFLILFFTYFSTYAQNVSFKEIKLKPKSANYKVKEYTIIYPVVVTKNAAVDKLINEEIKLKTLYPEDAKASTQKALAESVNTGLINLFYKVTFQKNDILSIKITAEGCGAYCSTSNTYFNFDLKTGKSIAITDIIIASKLDQFRKTILSDKIKALKNYKKEQLDLLQKNEIDSSDYDLCIEQVDNNCINSVQIEEFSLSANGIEIIDDCEFPHAIQSMGPTYSLKYSFRVLDLFLAAGFKPRLLN